MFWNKKADNRIAAQKENSKKLSIKGFTFSERVPILANFSDKNLEDVHETNTVIFSIDIFSGKIKMDTRPPDDPSTVYLRMPIKKPNDISSVPRPNYFPSYAGLSEEQKWVYLNWLQNVEQPIDIGYVFIYFYGLERHLIMGNFDEAFDEIIVLKKHHKNKSFTSYSNDALLFSCIFKQDREKMEKLRFFYDQDCWEDEQLFIKFFLNEDIHYKEVVKVFNSFSGFNKRYIKSNFDQYLDCLKQVFSKRYCSEYFSLSKNYEIDQLNKRQFRLFANMTFPDSVKYQELPSFLATKKFMDEISYLHETTHEATKNLLQEMRKKK